MFETGHGPAAEKALDIPRILLWTKVRATLLRRLEACNYC